MRLSGVLILIGAAMVCSAGTAGAATSRALGGRHGHGHHHDHPHGHGHGKGRRHHHDHDELYFRVMVPAGVTDETVHRHGPISIKASCKEVSAGTRSRALLGADGNVLSGIQIADEEVIADVHLEASLSVHVKPRAEDCKEDVDFTEHVLTSWDGDGMVHHATRDSPFDSSVWPSHPGGISVATASGYYVGFDGDRVISMVGSESEVPFFEKLFNNICDEPMDEDFEGCVIITTLEVHGVASDDKCF